MPPVKQPPQGVGPDERHEREDNPYGNVTRHRDVDSEEGEHCDLRPQSYSVTKQDIRYGFEKGLEARLHNQLGKTVPIRSWIWSW